MLPVGSDTGIGARRDGDLQIGLTRRVAVFGRIERALHVLEAGADGDDAVQVVPHSGLACEVGQPAQREMHLRAHASVADVAHLPREFRLHFTGFHKIEERPTRIDARDDSLSTDLPSIDDDANGVPTLNDDALDGCAGPDLRPRRFAVGH